MNVIIDDTGIVNKQAVLSGDIVMFHITPSSVNNMDLSYIDAYLRAYDDSNGKVYGTFLPAFAYDNDHREIYTIPEIRRYVAELFAKHEDFLYYIPADIETYRPLLLSYIDIKIMSTKDGNVQIGVPDIKEACANVSKLAVNARKKAAIYGNVQHANDIYATAASILPIQ